MPGKTTIDAFVDRCEELLKHLHDLRLGDLDPDGDFDFAELVHSVVDLREALASVVYMFDLSSGTIDAADPNSPPTNGQSETPAESGG